MGSATVIVTPTRALLLACEELGIATDRHVRELGLEIGEREDFERRLPAAKAYALWTRICASAGRSDLPLRAAEKLPFGAYRVIDYLCAFSETVGQGLGRGARYFGLIGAPLFIHIEDVPDGKGFRLQGPRPDASVARMFAEYTLASFVLRTRRAAGVPWSPVRVEFTAAPPAEVGAHERLFGAPVRFAASADRMIVSQRTWDTPTERGEPELALILEQHASELLEKVGAPAPDFAAQVRQVVDAALPDGGVRIAQAARALNMSARTLQRRPARA